MTRTIFNYVLKTYCNNDINNIITANIDNHGTLYLDGYLKTIGKGAKIVDVAIMNESSQPTGEYMTGILLYGYVANSQAASPQLKSEWYIPVEQIQGLGWKTTTDPNYTITTLPDEE